jgi:hypothetical protein
MDENEFSPGFKATEVQFVSKGILFVCEDEAEAQRAFCEAQLIGRKVEIDGKNLTLLKKGVLQEDEQRGN